MKTINISIKEKEFLNKIKASCYSDQTGYGDYITSDEYDMKEVRGVMSSLKKKGIIGIYFNSEKQGDPCNDTWVWIKEEVA